MRNVSIAALLLLLAPVLACAQQQSQSVCSQSLANAATADEVILTVCNHTYGMAPSPQPRLYFRLHASGRIEYEVPPGADDAGGAVSRNLLLKETQAGARDVDEIIRLGQMKDFRHAGATYPRYRRWTDSQLESTIIFRFQGLEKKIVVNNFSPQDALNRTHYPASLLAMLEKIRQLRPLDYPPSVRDMLINQHDFLATETFTSAFMGHGFSTTYQTSKRQDCYRRQSATEISYSCLSQPSVVFYPKTREYREEPRPAGDAAAAIFISDVQTFARVHKDADYTLSGTQMIGEQECLKIEVKLGSQSALVGQQEVTYVFYAAKNLNNLVIGVDATGKDSYASSRLSNVRLDFPDSLFQRPAGYSLKRP